MTDEPTPIAAEAMPDPDKVEVMAGYGLSRTEIAKVLRIDPDRLKEACVPELETGRIKANLKVAENLYRKATGDGREAVTAAIFWLKTRASWKETNVHELGGLSGQTPDEDRPHHSGSANARGTEEDAGAGHQLLRQMAAG
jgi:hypothetical protein